VSEVGRSEEHAQEPEHKPRWRVVVLRRRRRRRRSQDNRGGGCDEEERSVCEREDVSEVGGSEHAQEPEHKPRWNVGLRRRSGSFGRGRSSCRGSERDEGDTNERFVASSVTKKNRRVIAGTFVAGHGTVQSHRRVAIVVRVCRARAVAVVDRAARALERVVVRRR
jgi:hypothetical protein